jgi:hypothetical protein
MYCLVDVMPPLELTVEEYTQNIGCRFGHNSGIINNETNRRNTIFVELTDFGFIFVDYHFMVSRSVDY